MLDLEDFIVSNNLLPLGSLAFVLFCTQKKNGWGWQNFLAEANDGEGRNLPASLRNYLLYVLPILIITIYIKGYYDMFRKAGAQGPGFLAVRGPPCSWDSSSIRRQEKRRSVISSHWEASSRWQNEITLRATLGTDVPYGPSLQIKRNVRYMRRDYPSGESDQGRPQGLLCSICKICEYIVKSVSYVTIIVYVFVAKKRGENFMTEPSSQRDSFQSRLGFILVSAGCAIGIGNVWKFPYLCGQYGGAAFILLYLLFLLILGIPVLLVRIRHGPGRTTQRGPLL